MTLCANCKAKVPSMRSRLNAVNSRLHSLCLGYHEYLPVYEIDTTLVENGFEASSWTGGTDRWNEEVGEGKFLTVTTYRMPSGRWEVVAYVN